jgi:Leucine-rich repeat (LRR) protein
MRAATNVVPADGSDGLSAHAIVCDTVTVQGTNSPLPEGDAAGLAGEGAGGPTTKKRKLDGSSPAPVADEDDVSWTICCMDGATFSVAVPEDAPVAALKRGIGEVREVPCFTMELFVKDVEEPLDDERPLRSLDRAPLFLLLKQASDRLALEALFKSTGGADWKEKGGWMTDADLGEWHGVTVDAEGRVTKLFLSFNGLVGPLPSEVIQLSALQELRLGANELAGPIPAELGQLGALTTLGLDENQLTGLIPAELGQLGALNDLQLYDNELSGPIPAELGQLGALTGLYLDNNQLSGPIPAELGQLGALTELYLSGNLLTGQEAFREYMEEHNPDCDLEL